jgi:ABC-2 type transport system ATP-binding protein
MAGIPASRIADVLELVELTEAADRKVRTYSLGMRQRLGLAAAMLGDPEVLVLDEPANGLDPMGVRWLRDLLRRLAGEGRTVLVSSHILAEVAQTVDSVVIIDRGRLMMQASLEELNTSAGSVVRVRTPEAQRLGDALSRDGDGVRVTYLADDRLEIAGVTPQRVGALAAELRIPLHESTTEVATLEDVFLGLTASLDLEEVLQ